MPEHKAVPAAVATTNIGGGYVEVLEQNVGHYAKLMGPIVVAALVSFNATYGHGNGLFMLLSIVIAVAAAVGTWAAAASETWYTSLKFWVGVVATVAQAVLIIVGNNGDLSLLTPADWSNVGLQAAGVIWAVLIPNQSKYSQKVVQVGALDPVTDEHIIAPMTYPGTEDAS